MKTLPAAAMHRIDLTPARRLSGGNWIGHDKSFVRYCGELVGEFRCPLCEMSRLLLERGLASEADTIAAFRNGVLVTSGRVGALAKLTVRETDRVGPVFAKWSPFEEGRFRLRRLLKDGLSPPGQGGGSQIAA